MIKYLEDLLHEKTKDTQSEILFAQWSYDKKIIPSALQAVSNLFPHYSLHDESHSITILNNIIRVLGKENIAKLSAIDIWLILEAAYCHDIGMVVSSEKLIEAVKSTAFIDFFKELIQDTKNGLHEFAVQFDIVDDKIRFKNDLFNLELNDGIKFILAEFFRKIHAERSKEIINNPFNELSLVSPRGVIPPRIFKILANICSCHTKDFVEVLNLPFCEVGIDIEDAHPRFIACLLRIGDLLDLDNNRFSEVMLRTLTKVPVDTLNHKSKHLSIESFRVDRNIIEITANCKDYDTANVTQHWFNYLNSEISQQMINWNNIVPFKELGYLPTIGNLKVELTNYDLIDGKNKPKFTVDTDKALNLLQGAGIYEGAYQCIREILQNAVDASLIRIWLENKDKDFSTPQSIDFINIKEDYFIKITITERGVIGEWQNWEIKIEDRGTGISSYDLTFLMNTGSSSKNREKINIIDNMPTWMKPSGTFGIGFQSVFMLTDQVKIETKSFFDEEFQVIELNSPNSKKDGDILIQKRKTTHAIKPGTIITINHKTKAVPDGYSIKSEHRNASRIAHNFDPFSNESMDIEIGKVIDEIGNFAYRSYIPINLKVDKNKIEIPKFDHPFKFYDPTSSLEFNINYGNTNNRWSLLSYYKNQIAEHNLHVDFLGFEINIHKDKASDVLTLNRNKIRSEYRQQLNKEFFRASFKIIIENFESIFKTEESKCLASMYLNYYANLDVVKEFDIKQFDQWKNFEVPLNGGNNIKFLDLVSSIEKLIIIYNHRSDANIRDEYDLNEKELTVSFSGGSPSYDYSKFFLLKAEEKFTSIEKITNPTTNIKKVVFSLEKQGNPIPNTDIKQIIINLKKGYPSSARAIIPCPDEFYMLRIKDNSFEPYVYHYLIDYNIKLQYPLMLSPYVRYTEDHDLTILKKVVNEKLIEWVFENRFDKNTSKEEIITGYESFCEKVDLNEINEEKERN